MPAEPSRPAKERGRSRPRRCSARAERPVIMFGRGSRKPEFWQSRIRLAERLGACVVTDLKQGAMFPDRPSGALSAAVQCSPQAGARARCARRTSSWRSTGSISAAHCGRPRAAGKVSAKIIAATLDQNLHTGANMEYQALARRRRIDGDDRRRCRRGPAGSAGVGSAARSRGRRARRRSRKRAPDEAHHHGAHRRDPARGVQRSGERDASARSDAAGRSISGRFRTACPISARTAAAAWVPGPGFRSARRWRCTT